MGSSIIHNSLGLAVLGLLHERPMHPHGMIVELRARGMDRAFKLTTGSLYDVVRALERAGLIAVHEVLQVGARPKRTVYAPTAQGREEFVTWLDGLLRVPAEEFPRFLSAVTYLGALGPHGAQGALSERAERLRRQIEEMRAEHASALATLAEEGKPRLFVLEAEYAVHMRAAELVWIEGVIREIADGTLAWPEELEPPSARERGDGHDNSD